MSAILKKIKDDQVVARKQRDHTVAKQLTTLLGEASPSGNDSTTDDAVIKVVKKFIKNANEMRNFTTDAQEQYNIDMEIALYENYLPRQLNSFELRDIIKALISETGADNIGKIMAGLNKNYKGEFDGKLASQIAKEELSS
jgi:uncharacterized protein YqeY